MKKIKLNNGFSALIDDEDYEKVSSLSWVAQETKGLIYARHRDGHKTNGKRKSVYMHNLILNVPHGKVVDHIDGDGLNNQKYNLRICGQKENLRNRKLNTNNKAGYKGVCSSGNKYRATIFSSGKKIHLGTFENPTDAARAYDEKAKELFGEFSRLNFN